MDYFATGKLAVSTAEQVISGLATACRENGCAYRRRNSGNALHVQRSRYGVAGTINGRSRKIENAARRY